MANAYLLAAIGCSLKNSASTFVCVIWFYRSLSDFCEAHSLPLNISSKWFVLISVFGIALLTLSVFFVSIGGPNEERSHVAVGKLSDARYTAGFQNSGWHFYGVR
jgi:hypothetical protein